jgi:hypothetical protein
VFNMSGTPLAWEFVAPDRPARGLFDRQSSPPKKRRSVGLSDAPSSIPSRYPRPQSALKNLERGCGGRAGSSKCSSWIHAHDRIFKRAEGANARGISRRRLACNLVSGGRRCASGRIAVCIATFNTGSQHAVNQAGCSCDWRVRTGRGHATRPKRYERR